MQSETGFPNSHQLKSYVASKSRLKLAARAVLSADAGLLVVFPRRYCGNAAFGFLEFMKYQVVKKSITYRWPSSHLRPRPCIVEVLLAVTCFSNDSVFTLKLTSTFFETAAKLESGVKRPSYGLLKLGEFPKFGGSFRQKLPK